MSLYEFTQSQIQSVPGTTFANAGFRERRDLQRLLREQISIVAPACMVIAEEFGTWDDGRRRIDLLCLDDDANLVVIELKRTDDGGHMELQAIRYAAMISTMTATQLVDAHAAYRSARGMAGSRDEAHSEIETFLAGQLTDATFRPAVRIVLAAADFSREITTTALWLNDQGIDITCIKLQPYVLDGRLLVHAQQVIPLLQAEDFQVRPAAQREQGTTQRAGRMTMDEILGRLRARSEREVAVALEIHRWLVESADEVFTTSDGFASRYVRDGEDYYPFKVTADGKLMMWFHYLKRRSRTSSDSAREEIRRRLNAIPGFDIPPDRIGGRPKTPLTALDSPSALSAFKAVIEGTLRPEEGENP